MVCINMCQYLYYNCLLCALTVAICEWLIFVNLILLRAKVCCCNFSRLHHYTCLEYEDHDLWGTMSLPKVTKLSFIIIFIVMWFVWDTKLAMSS